MPKYRLHYFPESGNSYKLALMLTLCGERFEECGPISPRPPARRMAGHRQRDGEIPVLEVDGERLDPRPRRSCSDFPNGMAGSAARRPKKIRNVALAVLGQPQAHCYMATYRFMRTFTPSGDPQVLKHFRRGSTISSHSGNHLEKNSFAIGARPDHRPTFDDGRILHYPADETGYDLAATHPANPCLARPHRALPAGNRPMICSPAGA